VELYLSRTEIRRQVAAFLGETTSTAQASQVQNQRNAIIDSAAIQAHADCRWVTAQRRVTVALGIQQNVLNYPTQCGAGGVLALALYDPAALAGSANAGYVKLEKRQAPVEASQDQQQITGGDTFQAVCGPPEYWWEEAGQINLWPYSDQAYSVRMLYVAQSTFANDAAVSIVDGMMIIYWTLWLVCTSRGDKPMADTYMQMYRKRNTDLRSWQATGQVIEISTDGSFDDNEEAWYTGMPRWSQAPTVR
jgi:hypothetical protein